LPCAPFYWGSYSSCCCCCCCCCCCWCCCCYCSCCCCLRLAWQLRCSAAPGAPAALAAAASGAFAVGPLLALRVAGGPAILPAGGPLLALLPAGPWHGNPFGLCMPGTPPMLPQRAEGASQATCYWPYKICATARRVQSERPHALKFRASQLCTGLCGWHSPASSLGLAARRPLRSQHTARTNWDLAGSCSSFAAEFDPFCLEPWRVTIAHLLATEHCVAG
jgi:hypothetical protein